MIVELEILNYRPGVEGQVTSAYGEGRRRRVGHRHRCSATSPSMSAASTRPPCSGRLPTPARDKAVAARSEKLAVAAASRGGDYF